MRSNPFKLIVALLCIFGIAFAAGFELAPKTAHAQVNPTGSFQTFSGSVNTETTVGQTAASTVMTLYCIDIASDTSGTVILKDGTGGTTIFNIPVQGGIPRTLGYDFFGSAGKRLTSRTLTATQSGATIQVNIKIGSTAS